MATYKTAGIILKRKNINEADRILTVLTEKRGKINAIAKGVRKPLSKLGSHIEPLYLVHMVMAEGKNLDTVTAVEVNNYFPNLRNELKVMGRAYRFGELIDSLTEEREDQRAIFTLFCECLNYLDSEPHTPILDVYFQVNALALLGYRPELHECVGCREVIMPEKICWSSEKGGVVCKSCTVDKGFKAVSPEAIKVLRLLLEGKTSILKRLNLTQEQLREIENLIYEFVSFLNHKELVSDRFIRSLGRVTNG